MKLGAAHVDRVDFSDHHIFQDKDLQIVQKKSSRDMRRQLVPAARPLGLEALAQIATSMKGEL